MRPEPSLRIVPRKDDYLDRKRGTAGEIYFDRNSNSIRCYDGITPGGVELARNDLANVNADAVREKLSFEGFIVSTEEYADPEWLTSLSGSKIQGPVALATNATNAANATSVTNGVYTTDTGSVTNAMLAGSIANSKLANSTITLGTTAINLGATSLTIAGLTSISATTFTGALTGNASTATTLQTARTINGVSFNGSANITVTAAAGTLTGTTLNSTVVTSSLTSVGVLNNLSVGGTATLTGAVTAQSTIEATGNISTEANVVVPTLPSSTSHATNKQYVDARAVAMAVALS